MGRTYHRSQLGCILGVGGGALAFLFVVGVTDLLDRNLIVLMSAIALGGFVGGWLRCFGIIAGLVSVVLTIVFCESVPLDPLTVVPWPFIIGFLAEIVFWLSNRLVRGNPHGKRRRRTALVPERQELWTSAIALTTWIAVVLLAGAIAHAVRSPILGGILFLGVVVGGVVLFMVHISSRIHK